MRATSSEGTALETAALEGSEAVVRLLLEHGAEPNACDANGWTPLHNAMFASTVSLGIVHALVAARADVNACTTSDRHTPLHLAHEADPKLDWKLVSGSDDAGRTAFYVPAIVQTIVAAGGDVGARSASGATPLHEAAAAGATSCVLALLHSGADPAARDDDGQTARDVAGSCWQGCAGETLERLREMLVPPPSASSTSTSSVATAVAHPRPWPCLLYTSPSPRDS